MMTSVARIKTVGRLLSVAVGPTVELSIILVNYNGMAYLSGCLDSIRWFSPPQSEVILIDNGSRDDSVALVEHNFPWVRVLRSETNLGFARGNNLAAAHAKGRFLLLLNTDTVLLEPIAPALEWLDRNTVYGILSIGMVDGQGTLRECTGHFPSPSRLAFLRRMLIAPHHYASGQPSEVDWVQGSFLLIRRHLWRELKGLDERYFMYVEDVDLCRRAQELGQKCALLPQMRYKHFGGYSAVRFPSQVTNLALYVDQHLTGLQRVACRAVLLFGCIGRVIWYGMRAIADRDEQSRTIERACRRALWELLATSSRTRIHEYGVRS